MLRHNLIIGLTFRKTSPLVLYMVIFVNFWKPKMDNLKTGLVKTKLP